MSNIPEVEKAETQLRLTELRQALGRIGDKSAEPVRDISGFGTIYQAPSDQVASDSSVQSTENVTDEIKNTDVEFIKEAKTIQGMNLPVTLQPGLYLTITPVTPNDFEVEGPLLIRKHDYYLRTSLKEKVSADLFYQPIDYRVVAYDLTQRKLYLTWEEGMPGR